MSSAVSIQLNLIIKYQLYATVWHRSKLFSSEGTNSGEITGQSLNSPSVARQGLVSGITTAINSCFYIINMTVNRCCPVFKQSNTF